MTIISQQSLGAAYEMPRLLSIAPQATLFQMRHYPRLGGLAL
jgi:hypothetical protein